MSPELTVLMSAHNGARFLREAVESILTQTYEDFEFIIVDDGSTDETLDVLRSYRDPRIRLLTNDQHAGLARSLNRGLRAARGALIARQDADDVSERDRLRCQDETLRTQPHVGLVGCGYTQINEHGVPGARCSLPSSDLEIRWAQLFYSPFVHTGVVFRASVVPTQVGFYNESFSYSMDFELWTRVAQATEMANLEAPLVRLRLHPCSMTATYGEKTLEGVRLRRARLGQFLGLDVETPTDANRIDSLIRRVLGSERLDEHELQALMRIHQAFCRVRAVSPDVRSAHWESLLKSWAAR